MTWSSTMMSFHRVRQGRTRILIDPDIRDQLEEMGIESLETIIEAAQIDPHRGGRQPCRIFRPKGEHGYCLVIRHYAHGGLLRRLLGDRFLLGTRPFREMAITEEIRRRGVPTAQVVAALSRRGLGPFHYGELVTKEIPGAKDMAFFLADLEEPASASVRALRRAAVRQAGRAVRTMHDRGIYHGDLNLKNILIQPSSRTSPMVFIIDFDRSKTRDHLSTRCRLKNLLRLNRSAEKWKRKGLGIRYTDKACFFQAYAEGDSEIVLAMKRHLGKFRAHARWHRMGWFVDRLLNPSDD